VGCQRYLLLKVSSLCCFLQKGSKKKPEENSLENFDGGLYNGGMSSLPTLPQQFDALIPLPAIPLQDSESGPEPLSFGNGSHVIEGPLSGFEVINESNDDPHMTDPHDYDRLLAEDAAPSASVGLGLHGVQLTLGVDLNDVNRD
jgi:hypothetical protein